MLYLNFVIKYRAGASHRDSIKDHECAGVYYQIADRIKENTGLYSYQYKNFMDDVAQVTLKL